MSELSADQVQRRRERARLEELVVTNLDDNPVFGKFAVRSPSGSTYEIALRSVRDRANQCSCPDFRTNQVGTCKHIEAVLRHLSAPKRKPLVLKLERAPRPAEVYLAYAATRELCLLRPPGFAERAPEVSRLLDRYFDSRGRLLGDPLRKFPELREVLLASGAVRIAPDVESFIDELRENERRAAVREAWLKRIEGGERLDLLRFRLYPYQERGALHLALTGRAILADDMGLGKTVQAIAASEFLRREEGIRRTLVVCPASLKHQWAKEIERFTGQRAVVVQGNSADRKAQYAQHAAYTIANRPLGSRGNGGRGRCIARQARRPAGRRKPGAVRLRASGPPGPHRRDAGRRHQPRSRSGADGRLRCG